MCWNFYSSYVAFADKKRLIGNEAKNQLEINFQNTFCDFKSELNKTFNVSKLNKKIEFTSVQIAAMMLVKLKTDAETFLSNEISQCVIAVPSYYSKAERKSILLAAGVAGLGCMFLIKETTAIALNYSFRKKFVKPKVAVFIDFGRSSIQLCSCILDETKLEITCEGSEKIGGRDIDLKLANSFLETLKDPELQDDELFRLRLMEEAENMKKKISLDTIKFQKNVETSQGKRHSLSCDRQTMESVCKTLFTKIEDLMVDFLKKSKLKLDEIDTIEIVGGSSRIPRFKEIVVKTFSKKPMTTMNFEESVSKGCAVRAFLSQTKREFKLKEYSLEKVAPKGAGIKVSAKKVIRGSFLRVREVEN